MKSKDPHLVANERKTYTVYILASRSLNFYIGATSNLFKRVWQHKNHVFHGFTEKYKINRLVHYETFDDVRNAIDREKQFKGWIRAKKIALIKNSEPYLARLERWLVRKCRFFDSNGCSRCEQPSSLRMTELGP